MNNVQVADDEQQAVAFGDLIQYWGKERKALLTRDPVVASFQESDSSKRDTLYMRADSMFVFTYNRDSLLRDSLRRDSLAALESAASDEFTPADGGGTTAGTASQSPEGEPQPVAPAETPMSLEDVEAAEKAVTEEEVAEPVLSEKEQKQGLPLKRGVKPKNWNEKPRMSSAGPKKKPGRRDCCCESPGVRELGLGLRPIPPHAPTRLRMLNCCRHSGIRLRSWRNKRRIHCCPLRLIAWRANRIRSCVRCSLITTSGFSGTIFRRYAIQ